ncbi:MAG: putative transport system permease protein [Actinomycetota bacterium]|jgi:putative ABC transport system permease protein|nr:putative transport system permease protein [Actinomycetota bacterium]
MRTLGWLAGLVRRRPAELLTAAVSIAVAVGFVASLGAFVVQSHAALTLRAAASVPTDWQVQLTTAGSRGQVAGQVARLPGLRSATPVSYARVPALESSGPAGTRQTGAAVVVALPPGYSAVFPGQLRHLLGADTGVLLLQQTAANLAVSPHDTITVRSPAGSRAVTVAGVVDMPGADSFFQVVGLAPGSGASAPPDNVVLVPPALFDSLTRGATVVRQLHVGFRHTSLPSDPQAAALLVAARANHFQAAVAGGALVGDNLGAALSAAGEDARYADLLFLLLGLPGIALAVVVAALVVALRSDRRRREVALLRLRGADAPAVLRMVAAEAAVTAALGAVLGVPLATLAVRLALPPATSLSLSWTVLAVVGGFVLALGTQLGMLRQMTAGRGGSDVAADAAQAPRHGNPWPLRAGLDVILLAGAVAAFVPTARSGYHVVLAPEGVPATQVNYAALAGPALAWPGLALLVWRLTALWTGRRRGRWQLPRRPGSAPELEAAALRRRRRVIARGAAGLAVALGLAASTAVFTATYRTQSRLDVALTVGSDVAVVQPPGSHVGPRAGQNLSGSAGVQAVEPLQHRFAYVGPDLQDIYGVRADTFARVAPLQDAFVPGGSIADALASLRSTPDGVLLSGETLHDYQLHTGDLIRIRLQTGADQAYRPVAFHVVGQVDEWPTAPKDSFIVANSGYLSRITGSDAVGTFLVKTQKPKVTAAALRSRLAGTGVQVQDVDSARAQVTTASGLAATDLAGLSRLELGFGVVLALACSALALLGGILERRRALVLLAALGASSRQRGRFLSSEARAVVAAGMLGGAVIGAAIAYLLIKVLTGIFDPPPAAATVPWAYLGSLGALVLTVTVLVVGATGRLVARAGPSELRDL